VVQELMVMLLLQRTGAPLNRDLILAATADEEAGGAHGEAVFQRADGVLAMIARIGHELVKMPVFSVLLACR